MPQEVQALLIQVGSEAVSMRPRVEEEIIVEEEAYTQLSIVFFKRELGEQRWRALAEKGVQGDKAFEEAVHKLVTRSYLDPYQRITKSVQPTAGAASTWKNEWGESVRGLVRVRTEAVEEVLAKSNPACVIRHRYKGQKYTVIPIGIELTKAMIKAETLSRYAVGIVPHKEAYGVRIESENYLAAKAILAKDITQAVGEEVMIASRNDGNYYLIGNVDKQLSKGQLAQALAKSELKWAIRPESVDWSRRGYNTHKVFALTAPPKKSFRLRSGATSTASWVTVTDFADSLKLTGKGFSGLKSFEENEIGMYKHQHRTNWAQRSMGAWSEEDVNDEVCFDVDMSSDAEDNDVAAERKKAAGKNREEATEMRKLKAELLRKTWSQDRATEARKPDEDVAQRRGEAKQRKEEEERTQFARREAQEAATAAASSGAENRARGRRRTSSADAPRRQRSNTRSPIRGEAAKAVEKAAADAAMAAAAADKAATENTAHVNESISSMTERLRRHNEESERKFSAMKKEFDDKQTKLEKQLGEMETLVKTVAEQGNNNANQLVNMGTQVCSIQSMLQALMAQAGMDPTAIATAQQKH